MGSVENLSPPWRTHSLGSHGGECALVGRFDREEEAQQYLGDLLPGFRPGSDFSAEWQELLAREGVPVAEGSQSPVSMAAVGSSVMLATSSTIGDPIRSLRTLLWKRDGRAVYSSVEERGRFLIATGFRFPDVRSLESVETRLAGEEGVQLQRKGLSLFGLVPQRSVRPGPESLEGRVSMLRALALEAEGTFGAELVPVAGDVDLASVLVRPMPGESPEWLFCHFDSPEAAKAVSRGLDGWVTLADRYLLVGAPRLARRVVALLQSRAVMVHLVLGPEVRLSASFWRLSKADGPSPDELAIALRARLPQDPIVTSAHGQGASASLETRRPGLALTALVATASANFWGHRIAVEPVPDHLTHALARLERDVAKAARNGGG
jgi:hypothetical protein